MMRSQRLPLREWVGGRLVGEATRDDKRVAETRAIVGEREREFSSINPNDNNKNLVLLYVYYPANCWMGHPHQPPPPPSLLQMP